MTFSNVKFNCIKGVPTDKIDTKSLSELGFPIDAPIQPNLLNNPYLDGFFNKLYETPFSVVGAVEKMYVRYILDGENVNSAFEHTLFELQKYGITNEELAAGLRSGCVYDLTADEVLLLLEEFVYLIETRLPRQLSDLYYSFDIRPNPAHAVFFDLAADKLNIERYTDRTNNNCGQFVNYTSDSLLKRIASGECFQSIYRNTCVTKRMISDAWREFCRDKTNIMHCAYHLRKIELAIFELSNEYSYSVGKAPEEYGIFCIYDKNGTKVLTVSYLSLGLFYDECDYDYDLSCSCITFSNPTVVIDFDEIEKGVYISSLIRSALKNKEFIENHRASRKDYFTYGRALEDSVGNCMLIPISQVCGCFSCISVFSSESIGEFDNDESVCCPHCGNATVITDRQGYRITRDFLTEVNRYMEENYDLYLDSQD